MAWLSVLTAVRILKAPGAAGSSGPYWRTRRASGPGVLRSGRPDRYRIVSLLL